MLCTELLNADVKRFCKPFFRKNDLRLFQLGRFTKAQIMTAARIIGVYQRESAVKIMQLRNSYM